MGGGDWQQEANLSSFPSSLRPQSYAGFGSASWAPGQQREEESLSLAGKLTDLKKNSMWVKLLLNQSSVTHEGGKFLFGHNKYQENMFFPATKRKIYTCERMAAVFLFTFAISHFERGWITSLKVKSMMFLWWDLIRRTFSFLFLLNKKDRWSNAKCLASNPHGFLPLPCTQRKHSGCTGEEGTPPSKTIPPNRTSAESIFFRYEWIWLNFFLFQSWVNYFFPATWGQLWLQLIKACCRNLSCFMRISPFRVICVTTWWISVQHSLCVPNILLH